MTPTGEKRVRTADFFFPYNPENSSLPSLPAAASPRRADVGVMQLGGGSTCSGRLGTAAQGASSAASSDCVSSRFNLWILI